MKNNINEWMEYKLSELFNIKYGVNLELNSCDLTDIYDDDGINFVSRTAENNGVSAKVKRINGIEPQSAGLITVAAGGSVLSTFLQVEPFYSGRDLYTLEAKSDISDYAKLFVCTLISKNKYKYNYGRQANKTLPDILIKLPVNSKGNPDWEYMETYTKSLHHKPITTSNANGKKLHDINGWKEFLIGDLFNIKRGDRIIHGIDYFDKADNTYCFPVITAKTLNNGVDGYYNEKNCDGNCIISCGEASGMFTTYQETPCWAVDTVRIYSFKDSSLKMNKYIGLFLSTILTFNMYRYSYGRKAKPDNMYPLNIKLPITEDGIPDWKYMEDYIKSLPYGDRI